MSLIITIKKLVYFTSLRQPVEKVFYIMLKQIKDFLEQTKTNEDQFELNISSTC